MIRPTLAPQPDLYGVLCVVELVRTFRNGWQLGAGQSVPFDADRGEFFVYDRQGNEAPWHKHCGPYSDLEQARWWINHIRENRSKVGAR